MTVAGFVAQSLSHCRLPPHVRSRRSRAAVSAGSYCAPPSVAVAPFTSASRSGSRPRSHTELCASAHMIGPLANRLWFQYYFSSSSTSCSSHISPYPSATSPASSSFLVLYETATSRSQLISLQGPGAYFTGSSGSLRSIQLLPFAVQSLAQDRDRPVTAYVQQQFLLFKISSKSFTSVNPRAPLSLGPSN